MPEYYDVLLKLLVLGDCAVGKTCLAERFTKDTYSEHYMSTLGVDFTMRTVKCGRRRVKLQIWDTSGQERFRSLIDAYYRGSAGALVVFDCTRRESFLSVQGWVERFRQHATDAHAPVVVVAGKADLAGSRCVGVDEARKLAEMLGCGYAEASSLTRQGVEHTFMTLTEKALEAYDADTERRPLVQPAYANLTEHDNTLCGGNRHSCC